MPLVNPADHDGDSRTSASSPTPAVRILSAFARILVISCGVLETVMFVITSSSTFQ